MLIPGGTVNAELRRANVRIGKFFKFAHPAPRREMAPVLKTEVLKNLGPNAIGFGSEFESRVRVLFRRGLADAAIAEILEVDRMTVNQRTKHWRRGTAASRKPERNRRH